MSQGRKSLEEFLGCMDNFSSFFFVGKSEISSRCACVLKCASLMNGGDPVGCLIHILHHTEVGKKILKQITFGLKSLG
jgi:hypothetical protein